MHERYPVAWSDIYRGHWVAADSNREVFELVRHSEYTKSSDHDVTGERGGTRYQGITIPTAPRARMRARRLLGDGPAAAARYRDALNPYLSPAVLRWQPMVEELTRACLDEVIESGRIDFVDDLANIVPAVFTLAMMGVPLVDWPIYCDPVHAQVYTEPDSPDMPRVHLQASMDMLKRMKRRAGLG